MLVRRPCSVRLAPGPEAVKGAAEASVCCDEQLGVMWPRGRGRGPGDVSPLGHEQEEVLEEEEVVLEEEEVVSCGWLSQAVDMAVAVGRRLVSIDPRGDLLTELQQHRSGRDDPDDPDDPRVNMF
ncbi:hypothetical protein EYF80_059524 [Liparis tanakae]|uniref:Uncharacterized protein n=1 Tax=Liparis tanakae TaxID=230148 RepID=A0A4Z2EN60_9TELE|nr:hypothetical protein EYF80_059524 [Liparis tanakae]